MGLGDIIEFSIKKNLEKWIKGLATALVSAGTPLLMKHLGLQLTSEQQIGLAATIGSAIVGGTNWLSIKYPKQFGWL